MKKIIRIASVIALASASLLYVGCTKDFSADIAKTNQDVAALNQKIETLNSTVQTINGTVENLKTTKADLSAVNAADQALDGKITALDGKLTNTKTDLEAAIATAKQEAIDAASADAATKLAAAKTELEGVINGVKAKVDSLEAFTVAQTDSLRKDVDSLYANCEALEARIAALEGRVDALAARITSIVAVPSMYEEFQYFHIDSLNGPTKDTAFFSATFAVTPKAAVENINAEDLKVNFKEGLTRLASALDTTCIVSKVVADKAKGEITVFVPFATPENFPPKDGYDYHWNEFYTGLLWGFKYYSDEDVITIPLATVTPHPTAVYFSLAFAGEDDAEAEYEVNSEYVKAHEKLYNTTIGDAELVKVDGNSLTKLTEKDKILTDTLAFNDKTGNFGKLLTTDCVTVAFNVSGKLLSADQFAELVGADINVEIDSVGVAPGDTVEGFKVTRDGTKLDKATFEHVGNYQKVKAWGFKVNGFSRLDYNNLLCELEETHYIGAKTVEFTLPAVTEPWTYTSWDKVSRTVSITDCEDVHDVVPTNGIEKDAFKITKDSGTGVNIAVTNAQRNEEAKDTVYNVVFTKKANISATPKDTVNITINWKYTLEGRPADKTIALADVDTLAAGYTSAINVAIDKDIVAKTFAAFDAAYDKAIDSAAVTTAIKNAEVALDSVEFNGKKVNGADLNTNKTAVVLPALSKAGAYSVVLYKTVFGIKYTYTYTINLKWKEKLYLHATPYISADGVAVVDADTTAADGVYTLKEMDMAKYLQVFNADTLAKGFSGYTVKFKAELEDSTKFANEKKDTTRGSIALSTNEVGVANGVLGHAKLDWSDYNGREVKVIATLVNSKDTVDTYTFKLKYNKPVTSFTAGTQTIKRVAGKDASAVLSKSFNIKGLYNGDKNLIVDTTGAWINGKNYYSCEIAYDIEKASFKVNGESTIFAQNVDYVFTPATNANAPETATIKFIGDNNNKPIEASIPVVLTYKYDYNQVEAYKDNVVIKVVNE